jgi:predicted TIM-barrel fold metal-dependent hydrolase
MKLTIYDREDGTYWKAVDGGAQEKVGTLEDIKQAVVDLQEKVGQFTLEFFNAARRPRAPRRELLEAIRATGVPFVAEDPTGFQRLNR